MLNPLSGLGINGEPGALSKISLSVNDAIAEPYRTAQLPDFEQLKVSALEAGSVGTGLSGSGPSVFSLCRGEEMASSLGQVKKDHFSTRGIESSVYVSRISEAGCKII